jgi:hypothetical protein
LDSETNINFSFPDSDDESNASSDSFASIIENVNAPIDASASVLVATCMKKVRKLLSTTPFSPDNGIYILNFYIIFTDEIIQSLMKLVKEKKREIREQRAKLDRLQVCSAELVPIYPGAPVKMEPVVLTFITLEKRVCSFLRNFLWYYYTDSE